MVTRPPLEPTSPNSNTIKFLCSYGGKIVPRYPDGKLRYQGGHTRVLAVHRSISFSELMVKMGDLCNTTITLRCQLPTEDLDALVTIKSDEDLANLIEEYDRLSSSSLKIRAFLSPPRSSTTAPKTLSPPSSEYAASSRSPSPKSLSPSSSFNATVTSPRFSPATKPPLAPPSPSPVNQIQSHYGCHHCHRNPGHVYLIHNGNHWQWPN